MEPDLTKAGSRGSIQIPLRCLESFKSIRKVPGSRGSATIPPKMAEISIIRGESLHTTGGLVLVDFH